MAIPRQSKVSPSLTVTWSDATVFDGFLIIGVVPPTLSSTDFANVAVGNLSTFVPLPKFYRFRIDAGKVDQSVGVYYTSDVSPPGVTYVVQFQDKTGRMITSSWSAAFTVTDSTFTPTVPTMTVPTSGATPPTLN